MKESLEGLKTFVWFEAEVCIPLWWCLGNRLGGMTLLLAIILSWFVYASLGRRPDIQARGSFHANIWHPPAIQIQCGSWLRSTGYHVTGYLLTGPVGYWADS